MLLKIFKMTVMAAILNIDMQLAILNINVAPMPLTKYQFNPTYGSGKDENVTS